METYIPYIAQFSIVVLFCFQWLIIFWVVASWLVLFQIISPSGSLYQNITKAVQPVIKPFRFARIGMFDLSPIIALLVLNFLISALQPYLYL
ncbi:MAG TPA: YggT family protein [Candidatus Gracilibacteria bacterium]